MTDLEGRALDEALARAMGREVQPWHQNYEMALPLWHASLDALLRDIEPVCPTAATALARAFLAVLTRGER